MWDNPTVLNRISLTLVLLVVLSAAWAAARQAAEAWLPVRALEVRGTLHPETVKAIRPVLAKLSGGLFAVDLEALRHGVEALPWVQSVAVRRQWPGTLVVEVQEHVPAAAWNDLALLDVHGEVFPVKPWAGLPRFHAPEGTGREVAKRYGEFARVLGGHGWRIAGLRLDARHAWRLELENGVTVELGRERLDERLRRFVTFYPLAAATVADIRRVDMRYPNGFAVQGEART